MLRGHSRSQASPMMPGETVINDRTPQHDIRLEDESARDRERI